MDTQQEIKKKREKEGGGEEEKSKQKGKESQSTPTITSSSPSPSSSPSHEFSFTISLHPSSAVPVDKSKSSPPSFAIDLSPADDIFFHGHLLPLHLLSHLPISPRSSTNSFENFSIPIKDLSENRKPITTTTNTNNNNNNSNTSETKGRSKAKYFSLFGLTRWRKGSKDVGKREKEEEEIKKNKRKVRLNVSNILKRYLRIIRPHLLFRESEDRQFKRKHYSFSGNLSWEEKQEWRGRRQFSAPASMWTSPTNSGLLVATPTTLPSPTNESTMEELQSAIQAAIAHCKNSIAMKEEIKPKC